MALGNGSTTVPSTRIVSSLGVARTLPLLHDGRAERRAKTFEGRPTMLYESGPARQSDKTPKARPTALQKVAIPCRSETDRSLSADVSRRTWPSGGGRFLPWQRQHLGA